jgi:hypothetical protein
MKDVDQRASKTDGLIFAASLMQVSSSMNGR